jgi:hypothetical protein
MTLIKTKSFKHSLVGILIPCTKNDINTGKVGTAIEDLIESTGIKVNRQEGVDLIDYGVEVKSRCSYANTFIGIATMHKDYIIQTPYKDSLVCRKLQQVRIVDYDFDDINNQAIITADKIYDWSDPALQNVFEHQYERGRKSLMVGLKPSGWWEPKTGTKNSFVYKIYASEWIKMKNRCDGINNFDDIFVKHDNPTYPY